MQIACQASLYACLICVCFDGLSQSHSCPYYVIASSAGNKLVNREPILCFLHYAAYLSEVRVKGGDCVILNPTCMLPSWPVQTCTRKKAHPQLHMRAKYVYLSQTFIHYMGPEFNKPCCDKRACSHSSMHAC